MELPHLRCYRCFYEWVPRKDPVPACPRCRSKLYATPRIRPVKLGKGLGIEEVVRPHLTEIRKIARLYGLKRIRVFGSVRRSEGRSNSDVDFLVSWKRKRHSILDRLALASELEDLLGRRVDIVNESALHWAIAPRVESEAVEV